MAPPPLLSPPPPELAPLIDHLERHSLATDGSLLSRAAHADLVQAREEMARERARYLEALAVYSEAMAMVEEYQHAVAAGGSGVKLNCPPQVYETLEHHLVVAEAAQRLRLPLLSLDGEIHEEEIEKLSNASRSSFDSTTTSVTPSSSSFLTGYTGGSISSAAVPSGSAELADPGVGGVPNCFLGITPSYLFHVQQEQTSTTVETAEYQGTLVREIEARLEAKCDALADITLDDDAASSICQISSARLPERVKLIIDGIEKEEALLLDDLSSMDRKFAEHFNVLEQILSALVKFVKDLKLNHQHHYDELKKTWLSKRFETMSAKLSVLEYLLLRDTYTKESVAALFRIRKYLVEATEEATVAYNKAATRLREYQGVDPHFDAIARQYNDCLKDLKSMESTIHEVEMDIKRPHTLPLSLADR